MHAREEIEQACFLWKEWFSWSVDNREFHLISADGPQYSRTSLGELDWYNRIRADCHHPQSSETSGGKEPPASERKPPKRKTRRDKWIYLGGSSC
ncbi:hypothetical protein [Bacillus smithii]|uniref:hypothetical protein n=1 Tax=Bacillus smithii TaxID=1479 RepID=UPI003D20D5D6